MWQSVIGKVIIVSLYVSNDQSLAVKIMVKKL